ncbi:hypothetical protein [Mycolicibacterium goodii]|uniref:hypothetical protein n=1 Tax=Mycolicibacterium goodii TaxID=134601 RepID=UPI001056ABA8|nr:hypothetical protein [Mycolicibacterium goodii]
MYNSAVVDLRQESSWEPGQLTAHSFKWPTDLPEVRLGDLVIRVAPGSVADAGAPVITPSDVDKVTGSVRRRARTYQGAVFQVGTELRAGDILVPRFGTRPALLVHTILMGSLVSERFTALRPRELEHAGWIWAVLNSESGLRLRAGLISGAGSSSISPTSLLRAPIPVPTLNELAAKSEIIDSIVESTHSAEEEPAETWWGTADLCTVDWRIALATQNPAQLAEGVPFGDYCAEIVRGRNTRRDAIDFEAPGYLAVADVSMLGGKPPRRWVPAEAHNQIVAHRGELLIAALGDYAYATVIDSEVVVDQHVYRIRLKDPSLAVAIARYLNSADGFGLRRILLSGATVPSLNKFDVGHIPIPDTALDTGDEMVATVQISLAQRLEEALWQN